MKRELIAQVAHEINRAYCDSLGDASQPAWADVPEWQQASALAGVDMHLANPDATPEQSHASWLAQKVADGWVYGEVKDAEKKQHPCCVPYDELPPEQKAKDYLFRAVVHSLNALPDQRASGPVVAPVVSNTGKIAVRYIGKREHYTDGAYGTHIQFTKGETVLVPADKARLMLAHPDVYELGAIEQAGEPVAEVNPNQPKDEAEKREQQAEDLRQQIALMDAKSLRAFAKTHFNKSFAGSASLDKMRAEVGTLFEQYGLE